MNMSKQELYELSLDSLPGRDKCDEYGDLLVYSKKSGWALGHFVELESLVEEGFTHWTTLPDPPPSAMTQEELEMCIVKALKNLERLSQMLHDYWYTTLYSEPLEDTTEWIKVPEKWTERTLKEMEDDVMNQLV